MTESLRFEVSDLATEVELMRRMSEKFLLEEASEILRGVKEQIDTLRYRTHDTTIAVDANRPIRTRHCNGGYERNNGGTYKDLFGELLFKWEFPPLGNGGSRLATKRQVEVIGIASSVARLRINICGEKIAIASWRMEFGDSASPGAFFHAQIPDTLGKPSQGGGCSRQQMWPTWLPVPRFPIPAMTPMLALEFIIAEIFQERWPQHLASGGYEVEHWRSLQSRRFVAYFNWQRKNVESSVKGSPILATKEAKPVTDFFLAT